MGQASSAQLVLHPQPFQESGESTFIHGPTIAFESPSEPERKSSIASKPSSTPLAAQRGGISMAVYLDPFQADVPLPDVIFPECNVDACRIGAEGNTQISRDDSAPGAEWSVTSSE